MKSNIITSKGGSQFHPMIAVILFLCCVPAFGSGQYVIFGVLVLLMILTLWMDKTIKINLDSRQYKEGLFSSWDALSLGGYVSIFSETSGQKMKARSQSTNVKITELRLNYIQGKHKKHIYTAKTMEDAIAVSTRLADVWDVGVYDAKSKEWIRQKGA